MKCMLFVLNFVFVSLFIGGSSYVYAGGEREERLDVVTSVTNDKEYYHLEYVLTKENIISLEILTNTQFKINGGQFEVLIKKSMFPIGAPSCKSNIILRMPWSNPEGTNYELSIDEKYEVYKQIRKASEAGEFYSVDVVVELNPYVNLDSGELKLTQCNVFFRHANDRYISYTGSLK